VSNAIVAEGDEGYAAAGLQKDGTMWARLTWIGSRKTVTLVTSEGAFPDSMIGKIGVRTLALSAKDVSSKAAVKDTARCEQTPSAVPLRHRWRLRNCALLPLGLKLTESSLAASNALHSCTQVSMPIQRLLLSEHEGLHCPAPGL